MKTQIISMLSGMILVASMSAVQATTTTVDANVQVLPQEISDIFLAEVEVDGISLLEEQEMAESFGSYRRNCAHGLCCQRGGRR